MVWGLIRIAGKNENGVHAKVVGQLNELSYKAMLPTTFECTRERSVLHSKM